MRGNQHIDLAKARQDLKSDALLDDDQKNSDFFLFAVVFLIVVGVCTFLALSFGVTFGPVVLIPSMAIGFGGVAIFATRLTKRRHAREATIREQRQLIADAELARKVKDMKRSRFEKGL